MLIKSVQRFMADCKVIYDLWLGFLMVAGWIAFVLPAFPDSHFRIRGLDIAEVNPFLGYGWIAATVVYTLARFVLSRFYDDVRLTDLMLRITGTMLNLLFFGALMSIVSVARALRMYNC
jgi:hypothetical protein